MLNPEYFDMLDYSNIVKLYTDLNIEITEDIIDRIIHGEEITETSLQQLKRILETNGDEIFYNALNKTKLLNQVSKNELKKTFENMAREDLEGYKELFYYRNKEFKLSDNQVRILNTGYNVTNKALKNLTKTTAFSSKQLYVNVMDKAYMKVISGAFDYNTSISQAVKEVAEQGITLKDKAGRNVQLEVAVRRNVLGGIQQAANLMNRDIEKELGCNGYEVTAHSGARPTHAEAQGKQYALNINDAKEYGVELWDNVKDLWSEYNCRHTYFGIILGISEPQYTKKELNSMENETVTLNSKEVPLYEAIQKQRQYENSIRKLKKSIEILENKNQDTTIERTKLLKQSKLLNEFCKQTGLDKDYSRTRISTNKLTINEKYAITKYIGSYSYKINESLRNEEYTNEVSKLIKDLDKALEKCNNYKGNVIRVLDIKDKEKLKKFIKRNKLNKEIVFEEYLSFSSKKGYNDESNIIIYVESNHGKDLRKYNSDEQEIVYPRNSKFITKNIVYQNGKYYILWEEKNE